MYQKFINGHTSCWGVYNYLLYDKETGKKRSIYSKTYNMAECFSDETGIHADKNSEPWYKVMDQNRKNFGTDKSWNGKKALTFKHYVLSPNPKDKISPKELSEFIDEWLDRGFATREDEGKFEVAVEMHNDNGILHAHVIFNNINWEVEWEKSQRITGYLTPKILKQTRDLVQVMCLDRGWHNFLSKDEIDIEKAKREIYSELDEIKEISQETKDLQFQHIKFFHENKRMQPFKKYQRPIEVAANGKIISTRKGSYIDKKEAEILKRQGYSNKEDIRKVIDIAIDLSNNLDEFARVMHCFNLPFKINNRGDFVYTHPKDSKRQFTGHKLGLYYTRNSIIKRLKQNTPLEKSEMAKRRYYTGKLAGAGVLAVYHYDSSLSIQELASVVSINNKYNIWNNDDYEKKIKELPNEKQAQKEELKWAMEKNKEIYSKKPPRTHLERIEKEISQKFLHEMTDEDLAQEAFRIWKDSGYDKPAIKKKKQKQPSSISQSKRKASSSQQVSQNKKQQKNR